VAIAVRDLASLKREKTIVLALLIQLFVAAFSSFLVVGLTSLYDPGTIEGAQVRVGVSGEVREDLANAAAEQQALRPVTFDDRTGAMAAFDDGRVQAVLHGTVASGDAGTRVEVEATVPAENLRTTVVVVQLRRALTTLEAVERDRRAAHLDLRTLETPDRVDASPYFGFTYTVLIPLLLFLPPFISGSVAVDSITEELERGTLEILRVAPVSLVDVVDGKGLGLTLLAPAQVVLWLGLLAVNGITVGNPLALLALVTAITTLVVTIGVGLGVALGQRRQAQLLYSTVVLVLFGLAAGLPEHPATTVAKLAVESGTLATLAHVGFFVALAVTAAVVARRYVAGLSADALA